MCFCPLYSRVSLEASLRLWGVKAARNQPSCKKRTVKDELEGLSVFVFVSPESGQTLVENCAAGWRFGSSLEAWGWLRQLVRVCFNERSRWRIGEGADVASLTKKQKITLLIKIKLIRRRDINLWHIEWALKTSKNTLHNLFSFYNLDSEDNGSSFTFVGYVTVTGEFLFLQSELAVSV